METIYSCIIGSHAYGLAHADSDLDERGVYLASGQELFGLRGFKEQVTHQGGDQDQQSWELRTYLNHALKANPNILETLWSPIVNLVDPLFEPVLAERRRVLSKRLIPAYKGYAEAQFRKLNERQAMLMGEKPFPPGYTADHVKLVRKHGMHLCRLLLAGISALQAGEVMVRIDDPVTLTMLRAIRLGDMPYEEVLEWRRELLEQFTEAALTTELPDEPDYAYFDRYLIETRYASLGCL